MANCLAGCSCEDYEGITKADLDRFTDNIENVLNDTKGRRLFRNFMYTCKMKDGRRALDFWENIEKLLFVEESAASAARGGFYVKLDKLLTKGEGIEELDFTIMERLTIARESENRNAISELLQALQSSSTKAMRREYAEFQKHYIPHK